jgi:hypothetical protein
LSSSPLTYTHTNNIILITTNLIYYHNQPTKITMDAVKTAAQKSWAFVVRHAKEHHESVNATVGVYYPQTSATSTPTTSPFPSAAASRRVSADSDVTATSSARSSMDKIWDGVKKHAREHHESVNGATAAYYGPRV